MKQKLMIGHRLPGMNEIIAENRKHHHCGAALKKEWQKVVCTYIMKARLKPMINAQLTFVWLEKNKKRDKDNISGGGRKFILDALVEMGILKGDGWNFAVGFRDHFAVCRDTEGVVVYLEEVSPSKAIQKNVPSLEELFKNDLGYEPGETEETQEAF